MAKEPKVWEPNENQLAFIKELRGRPDGITLFELKLEGKQFASGAINTLKGRALADGKTVSIDEDEREFACDIVYNGVVVGKTTKKGKVYRLVDRQ